MQKTKIAGWSDYGCASSGACQFANSFFAKINHTKNVLLGVNN